jgi:hypothetical protein
MRDERGESAPMLREDRPQRMTQAKPRSPVRVIPE